MTDTEKELYDTKISGVHQLIVANADVQKEVNAKILDSLCRIEAQVSKTNGRVTKLEKEKYMRTGITIALSSVFSVAIALFGVYLKLR